MSRARETAILLALVVALGAAVRLALLDSVPPGAARDECAIATDAYSVALTGHDVVGNRWPLFFPSHGDPKYPVNVYAAALSTALLGLDRSTARLPFAVMGTLTVLLVALLALEFDPASPRTAAFAGLVLALTPWHVHYSRMAWEGVAMPLFLVLGMWLHLRASRLGGRGRFALAGAAFGLAVYTYTPAKLLAALLLVALSAITLLSPGRDAPRRPWGEVLAFAAAAGVATVPMAFVLATDPQLHARAREHLVFGRESPLLSFALGYAAELSPAWLFWGTETWPNHGMPWVGQCLAVTAPLCVLGVVRLCRGRRAPELAVLAGLAIYPLGAALTIPAPHATRALLGAPLLALCAALGAGSIPLVKRRSGTFVVLGLVVLLNGAYALRRYFVDYPAYSARDFRVGKDEVLRYAAKELERGSARRVFVTFYGSFHEVLFAVRFDPRHPPPSEPWVLLTPSRPLTELLDRLGPEELLVTFDANVPGREPEVVYAFKDGGPSPGVWRGRGGR